jgi:hypothetical protein
MSGYVEALSTVYAAGWVPYRSGAPTGVRAMLGDEMIGMAAADGARADLQYAAEQGRFLAGGFFILFHRAISPAERDQLTVHALNEGGEVPRLPDIRIDRFPLRQIFVLGSPRSGTSEMGATLAKVFDLPWLGELHAADLFAEPAARIAKPDAFGESLRRFLIEHRFSDAMLVQARLLYFGVHRSASFLDKTPGVPMIRAAPFLSKCFPDARFIYLRRNGVANLCSRMVKFGAPNFDFPGHCHDWADALNDWAKLRGELPHYLELRQEDMESAPEMVAGLLAEYLEAPEQREALADSLRDGSLERTGAGVGRSRLSQTDWDANKILTFTRICGPTMTRFGYEM